MSASAPGRHAIGTTEQRSRSVAGRLLAGSAASLAGVFVLYGLAVRTRPGQRVADTLYESRRVLDPVEAADADHFLRLISVGSLAVAGAALVLVALARGRVRLALAVAGVIGVSCVTTEVLKRWLFSRPDLLGVGTEINSYPSGHTTVAMSLAMAAVLVVPRAWRTVVGLVGAAYAAAVGVAVLVSGWHRVEDAIGADLVVLAAALGACGVLVAWRGTGAAAPAGSAGAGLLGALGVGLLVVGGVALVVVIVALGEQWEAVPLRPALFGGAAMIVAASVLAVTVLLASLRRVTLDGRPA